MTSAATRQIARVDNAMPGVGPVQGAIANAAQQTSVEFNYLLAQAEVESSMDPDAKASTSSATGLYQFIESTWLNTMKRHGPRFGLGEIAKQIGTSKSGTAYVADPGQRQAILALRNDPKTASLMAAGLAEDNRAQLMPILGRQPDHGELYLAHFLGAGGAKRFLSELSKDPNQSAPDLFGRPAAANRSIFYERGGSPRSLSEVMNVIDGKMSSALARVEGADLEGHPQLPKTFAGSTGFGAANPILTFGTRRPSTSPQTTITSTGAAFNASATARPVAMSNLLQATFGENGGHSLQSAEGNAQIKRAYDRLKALGL